MFRRVAMPAGSQRSVRFRLRGVFLPLTVLDFRRLLIAATMYRWETFQKFEATGRVASLSQKPIEMGLTGWIWWCNVPYPLDSGRKTKAT